MFEDHSLEHRKVILISQLFIDPADQDYVCARWAFNAGMFYSYYALAAQAIEKYLKAALLHRNQDTSEYGHDILKMWNDLRKLKTGTPLPEKLSWPDLTSKNKMVFQDKKCAVFLKYLSVYGSPDNRYGTYGNDLDGSIIFACDYLCYVLRRYIRHNSDHTNDIFALYQSLAWSDETIENLRDWMLGPNFLLERLFDEKRLHIGENKKLRNAFKNMNLSFAPDYEHTHGSFGGSIYIGAPLGNLLVRQRELDSSAENNTVIDALADWVSQNVFINKNLRNELKLPKKR